MTMDALLRRLRTEARPVLFVDPDPGRPGRVALLPGSFDPITIAHAALAAAAADWADVVVMVYAARTIPKEDEAEPSLLPEHDRVRVLDAFCRTRAGTVLGLCSHGLLVDQVRAAGERFPGAELRLVVGSDKVLQLFDPRWYEDRDRTLAELFRHAGVLYAVREGEHDSLRAVLEDPGRHAWRDRFEPLDVPPEVAAVSSRLVRALLRRGEDVGHLVPPEAVAAMREAGARGL